jgi:hypothetical protein
MTDRTLLSRQFEARRPRLRALALRLLGSAMDTDDVLQETWLRWGRGARAREGAAAALDAEEGNPDCQSEPAQHSDQSEDAQCDSHLKPRVCGRGLCAQVAPEPRDRFRPRAFAGSSIRPLPFVDLSEKAVARTLVSDDSVSLAEGAHR